MPPRFRPAVPLVLALALGPRPAAALQRPCDTPSPLGPSRDLYCMDLVPAPGFAGASGRVELGWAGGPFSVAVTADGRPRVRLVLSAEGLPAPASLGGYRTYVAWVASPMMSAIVRLGPVGNGTATLGIVDLEKFTFLVTAERGAGGREPRGRMVLRGQSPSTRLFPPDLLQFSIGSMGIQCAARRARRDASRLATAGFERASLDHRADAPGHHDAPSGDGARAGGVALAAHGRRARGPEARAGPPPDRRHPPPRGGARPPPAGGPGATPCSPSTASSRVR
jgi:hypothetical protein